MRITSRRPVPPKSPTTRGSPHHRHPEVERPSLKAVMAHSRPASGTSPCARLMTRITCRRSRQGDAHQAPGFATALPIGSTGDDEIVHELRHAPHRNRSSLGARQSIGAILHGIDKTRTGVAPPALRFCTSMMYCCSRWESPLRSAAGLLVRPAFLLRDCQLERTVESSCPYLTTPISTSCRACGLVASGRVRWLVLPSGPVWRTTRSLERLDRTRTFHASRCGPPSWPRIRPR